MQSARTTAKRVAGDSVASAGIITAAGARETGSTRKGVLGPMKISIGSRPRIFAHRSISALRGCGRAPSFSASGSNTQYTAGAGTGVQVGITQVLGTEHQNPGSPSFANPVIADSTWTLRNNTSSTLIAPLLVFTRVDPANVYPITLPPTGLDADKLQFLTYSVANVSYTLGVVQLIFVVNFVYSLIWGPKASRNPWNSNTLEWTAPSPPPHGNFETTPIVYRGPYEYAVDGAEKDFLPQTDTSPLARQLVTH